MAEVEAQLDVEAQRLRTEAGGAADRLAAARAVRDAGATLLRGGAYKPRTSPYDFQGLKAGGLALLEEARADAGLGVVTEAMDTGTLASVAATADGRAAAVKVADGAMRATIPVLVAALRGLEVDGAGLDALAETPVLGHGAPVGAIRHRF